jgi:hypothetical protein
MFLLWETPLPPRFPEEKSMSFRLKRLALVALLVLPSLAVAQDSLPLTVGTVAPDFALVGANREGILADSVRLRDFRDQTVVIAFFYRARTRG